MNARNSLKNLSHHAYLLIGPDSSRTELISILEKDQELKTHGNPDFYDRQYQNFTVDDARELKSLHNTRPVGTTGKKIFILTMNGITSEAQNALLKLFEEPAEYAHFFLIIPSAHLLLPTVKSRMTIIAEMKEGKKENGNIGAIEEAQKFLKLSKAKRLEEIKKLVDDITKEKKTKQDAIDYLNAIQAVVYEQKGVKEGKSMLEAIEKARTYIHDRAPSMKMLLEYVALNV